MSTADEYANVRGSNKPGGYRKSMGGMLSVARIFSTNGKRPTDSEFAGSWIVWISKLAAASHANPLPISTGSRNYSQFLPGSLMSPGFPAAECVQIDV
jgi:hypothetical protein